MTTLPPGPYTDERGGWWVPVEAMGYLAARRLVRDHMDDRDWYRLVYYGRETASLDLYHEAGCDDDECDGTQVVAAWHFEEIER